VYGIWITAPLAVKVTSNSESALTSTRMLPERLTSVLVI